VPYLSHFYGKDHSSLLQAWSWLLWLLQFLSSLLFSLNGVAKFRIVVNNQSIILSSRYEKLYQWRHPSHLLCLRKNFALALRFRVIPISPPAAFMQRLIWSRVESDPIAGSCSLPCYHGKFSIDLKASLSNNNGFFLPLIFNRFSLRRHKSSLVLKRLRNKSSINDWFSSLSTFRAETLALHSIRTFCKIMGIFDLLFGHWGRPLARTLRETSSHVWTLKLYCIVIVLYWFQLFYINNRSGFTISQTFKFTFFITDFTTVAPL